MKPPFSVLLLVFSAILSVIAGCASPDRGIPVSQALALYDHHDASVSETSLTSTIKITGSDGTRFYGYYRMNGQKVEISDAVPQTIEGMGISRIEIKSTTGDTLKVEATNERGYANVISSDIVVVLDGGMSVSGKSEGFGFRFY